MPIPFNHKLKEVNGTVRLNLPNLASDKTWVAWWYCGVQKNKIAETQPHVLVAFRELVNGTVSDKPVLQSVLLDLLGQVRLGSVWKDGLCTHQAKLDTVEFDVDFTYKTWKTNSFLHASQEKDNLPFPLSIYPLEYPNDKNWLLEFPLPMGGKLVIPCLEFFTRCYGRSAELKRVLATYPWHGQNEAHLSRLYAALDEGEVDDGSVWKVKLKQRLHNGDVIFLAHAKYDKEYCEKVVKRIYAQIEENYDALKPNFPIPFKVAPWFQGEARLKVSGLWFDNKKSFLALNISGCSDPCGINILRDRTNTNKINQPSDTIDEGKSWNGAPQRIISLPEIIDITGDLEPDHNAPIVEVQDPDFEVLGAVRVVYDKWRDKAKSSAGFRKQATDTTVFATGDPHSSGKGVGYASINAKPVMESHGVLRDVWNAMLYLKKMHPSKITSVDWFTFDDGYQTSGNPIHILLRPFAEKTKNDIPAIIRNWVYINTNAKNLQPRGILVARMIVDSKAVYIIEIQRRARNIESESGKVQNTEEPYTGFVFTADNQSDVDETIQYFMNRVRSVRGIVKNLLSDCPSKAYAFQHKTAAFETVSCESAVLNALSKVGVVL